MAKGGDGGLVHLPGTFRSGAKVNLRVPSFQVVGIVPFISDDIGTPKLAEIGSLHKTGCLVRIATVAWVLLLHADET